MEIVIITVFNSHNFGSFLQAKQLSAQLEQYGNVTFYNSHTRNNFRLFLHKAKYALLHGKSVADAVCGPLFEFGEWLRIRKAWNSLKITETCDSADVLVLGSDEIWNIKRKECRYPIYWGHPSNAYKVSYAPSINKAELADFNERSEYIRYLQDVDRLSVRDKHSKSVLSQLTDKEIATVLDPTLLKEPEHIQYTASKPYIAVYLFEGTLEEMEKQAVIRFAKSRNLDIVSAGQYLSWCDRSVHSVDGNPFYIYENAEYVITNTFHGTAYAINHGKQFVSFAGKKPKIKAMLEKMGLENRIVNEKQDLSAVFAEEIDYTKIYAFLDERRKDSLEYIRKSIVSLKNDRENSRRG